MEPSDWWAWERKFFDFFFPLRVITEFAAPYNSSKQQPAEVDECSCLFSAG